MAGVVQELYVRQGEYAQPGATTLTILHSDTLGAQPAGRMTFAWTDLPADLAASRDAVRVSVSAVRDGMPAVVKESVLLPLFKKGDAADANNYRSIQLVSMLR